ncbi:hypothetical protein SK128_007592, partial [Halocaridina rubra]
MPIKTQKVEVIGPLKKTSDKYSYSCNIDGHVAQTTIRNSLVVVQQKRNMEKELPTIKLKNSPHLKFAKDFQ